ncbi:MAG: phytoene desaturase family protein [Paraclostridium sordellii]
MKDVIIVGAGIGGISTGIRLLKNGYKVTIIEKEDKIGGKLNQLYDQGYKFDLTASILMTPQIYIELFNYINKDYTNYIELIKLDTMYKVFYKDKSTYEFYSDIGKTIKYLENVDTDLSRGYLSFISKSYNKYTISNENFLEKPMEEFNDMVNFNSIKKYLKLTQY